MRRLYALPPGTHAASLFGRTYIVVTDPALVRRVLHTNADNYRKNYGAFLDAVGRSSLITHGAAWQRVRSVNQTAFRADHIAAVIHANHAIISDFADRLSLQQDVPVDLSGALGGLMIDLVANGMFARRTRQTPEEVFADIDCILPAMDRAALRFTSFGRMLSRATRRGFAKALHRWRRLPEELRTDPPRRPDTNTLLSHLCAHFAGTEDGERLIHDEMLLFLGAGSQTSVATLGFALLLLSQNPEILAAVRSELAAHSVTATPSLEIAERLDLLHAVVAETLRLYPPVWAVSRVAIGPDTLGNIRVGTNDLIIISYFGLHRSAQYWSNPERFDPQRFQGGNAVPRNYVYMPFGAGPRSCIAAQLATKQTVIILATILCRFDLTFRDDTRLVDAELRPGISLWPKRPIMARLKSRTL